MLNLTSKKILIILVIVLTIALTTLLINFNVVPKISGKKVATKTEDTFNEKIKCASFREKMISDQGLERSSSFFIEEIFYSKTLNSCLYTSTNFVRDYGFKFLTDFLSKKQLCEISYKTGAGTNIDLLEQKFEEDCTSQYR